jgi:predicted peptidase
MKTSIYACILAACLITTLSARTWKAADGRSLEAEFVSATDTQVTLKRAGDGKVFTLPLSRLSEADQSFIKEKATSGPAAESDTTEPAAIEGEYAGLISGDWELAEHKKLPFAFYGGKDLDGSKKYPLIISLHGKSDNNDNGKQIGFAKKFADEANYTERPCLILAPLCYQPYGGTGGGWTDAPGIEALDLIKKLVKNLPIVDPDRVYVIGYSMGGFGTWHFLKSEPRLFAAGIPIAGYSSGVSKLRSMPIWSFHGAEDTVVKVDGARACAEELKRSKVFKYTEFPDEGHGIPGKVVGDVEVHRWLFEQKR